MTSDDVDQALAEAYVGPRPTYNAIDYLQLPDYGERHYSLEDAALLIALDVWSSNRNPDFPVGDRDHRDADEREVRDGVRPMERQLLAALLRSVSREELKPEVFLRDLATGDPAPDRSYVSLEEIVAWMETYGFDRGDLIAEIQEVESDCRWEKAESVAEDRARFRAGVVEEHVPASGGGEDTVRKLLHVIQEQAVEIAHHRRSAEGGAALSGRDFGSRERRTLLTIVGALLQKQLGSHGKQEALIADLRDAHPNAIGLSKRNLESVFASARRLLTEGGRA